MKWEFYDKIEDRKYLPECSQLCTDSRLVGLFCLDIMGVWNLGFLARGSTGMDSSCPLSSVLVELKQE